MDAGLMDLLLIAGGLVFLIAMVSWLLSWVEQAWKAFRKRHARLFRAVPFAAVGAGAVLVWLREATSTVLVGVTAAASAAIVLVVFVTVLANARGRHARGRTLAGAGLPEPPQVRARPGAPKGLYALGFGNRAVADGRTVTDWKVGHGDIARRISAHTSAVAHPRLVVARLPCDAHDALERVVLRDLQQWKINVRTIPGEELFQATPEVEAYLRALWDGSGGSWEDRR